MEFTLKNKGGNIYSFVYEKDGEVLANIDWVLRDNIMDMNHTYVSQVLRGQGVAKKLLDRAAEYARENNYKMNPICSYVVSSFEKSAEYDDIKA